MITNATLFSLAVILSTASIATASTERLCLMPEPVAVNKCRYTLLSKQSEKTTAL